jgi:hypothetical protein
MRCVYLLWGSDTEKSWVEGVYTSKATAEDDLRLLEEAGEEDNPDGHTYWVQERQITRYA